MEFVGKAIFRTKLNGPVGFRTKLNGIRGQGHFGPTLMEFVGKAIFLGPTRNLGKGFGPT